MSKRVAWNVPFDREFEIDAITWVRADGGWGLGAQSFNAMGGSGTHKVKITKYNRTEKVNDKLTLHYYDVEYL
jgi:hypothetical protein